MIDIDALKAKVRSFFTLFRAAIASSYEWIEEAIVAFLDEVTPEERKAIMAELDEVGYHLVKAYRAALSAFMVAGGVAERVEGNPVVEEKMEEFEEKASKIEDFFDYILEYATDFLEYATDFSYFTKTREALALGDDEEEGEDVEEALSENGEVEPA